MIVLGSVRTFSRRRLSLAACASALLLAAGLPAAGGAAEELRLVTGNDYAPYTDENLPEGGLVNELVKRIYDSIGIKYAIDWKPWRRGYEEGAAGEYVATYPYIYNEERNRYFAYSEPIYQSNLRLFSRIDAALDPAGIDDLRDRRVCLPLGWAPGQNLAEMFAADAVTRDMPPDIRTCFRLLDRARTDFVLANEIQGWSSAEAVGLDDQAIEMSAFNIEVNPVHVIFSRKAPDFEAEVARFNAALASLRESGAYDKIVAKHLGVSSTEVPGAPNEPDSATLN